MFDTTSTLMNTRTQVRWEAMRRVDRLELLFPPHPDRRTSILTQWSVILGNTLIRLGEWLVCISHPAHNVQPLENGQASAFKASTSTFTPCP